MFGNPVWSVAAAPSVAGQNIEGGSVCKQVLQTITNREVM
jgi:hypothetical protein